MSEYIVQKKRTEEEKVQALEGLCEALAKGETLSAYARRVGVSYSSLYKWTEESPESLKKEIARARKSGADAIAEECLYLADDQPERDKDGKIDPGFIAWKKQQIYTRLQLLSKWDPKRYGDKQQVEHSGGVSLFDAHAQGLLDVSDDGSA